MLAEKVANERITKELDLIFGGENSSVAIEMAYKCGILRYCTKLPENFKVSREEHQRLVFESLKSVQLMSHLHQLFLKNVSILGKPLLLPEKVDLFYLSLILPYAEHKYMHKGKQCKVYEHIAYTGFKVLQELN